MRVSMLFFFSAGLFFSCTKKENYKEEIFLIDTTLTNYPTVNRCAKTYLGSTLIELRFLRDSIPHGPSTAFYSNGKIKQKGNYRGGFRIGEFNFYDSLGKPERNDFYYRVGNSNPLSTRFIYTDEYEVDTSKSIFYNIVLFGSDTVELGDTLEFMLTNTRPNKRKNESFFLLGNYDVYYQLRDSSSLRVYELQEEGITVKLTPKTRGEKTVRGLLSDVPTMKFYDYDDDPNVTPVWFNYYVR